MAERMAAGKEPPGIYIAYWDKDDLEAKNHGYACAGKALALADPQTLRDCVEVLT